MPAVEILALVVMVVGVGAAEALLVAAVIAFFGDAPLWPFVIAAVLLFVAGWAATELLLALGFDGCIGACTDA